MAARDTAPRPTTRTADPVLLCRIAAGDDATWRQVVRQYEGLLRGSARAVLRNDADVDEAVQRTWILLLNNAHRINDVDRLPGWLATTVRREALPTRVLVTALRRHPPLPSPPDVPSPGAPAPLPHGRRHEAARADCEQSGGVRGRQHGERRIVEHRYQRGRKGSRHR